MRDSEDRNAGEGWRRSERAREYGTQGIRKVHRLPQPHHPTISNIDFRLTSEIERTLKRWANAPHTEYDKEEVDGHKLEIQQILGTLTVLLNGNVNVGERGPNLAPANPHGIATTSVSGESGTLSPSLILCEMLIVPQPVYSPQLRPSSLWTFDQTRIRSV